MDRLKAFVTAHGKSVMLVALFAALLSPPIRSRLEASMFTHMLVQLPLLGVLGWWLGRHIGVQHWRGLARYNAWGVTGLVAAGFIMTLWMLPRLLDSALAETAFAVGKFVTLPLAGCAVAASWPHCLPIMRAVVHVEVLATFLRFGWGYMEAPAQLCWNYGIDDQWLTGQGLLAAALVYAVAVTWPILFGRPARFAFGLR